MGEVLKSEAAKREEEVLAFWNERGIFRKSLEKHAPRGEYVFYDGPPFATGLPHYGHIVASLIKDVVPRYATMRGYHVPRVWGWDCHGLPIENIVEKELGFKHKKDIKDYGVAKFNERCRARVLTYAGEWEKIIPRIGRWVDMTHAYRTMDKPFMESVWWVFKQLYDRSLVYEDYRTMHICPRCETTLSQQEVSEGYKDVKDIAVTVKFKVKEPQKYGLPENTFFLAWTTTPWTLPGNVALAVGPQVRYRVYKKMDEHFVVAEDRARSLGLEAGEIIGTRLPQDLEGIHWVRTGRQLAQARIEYEPPFPYYAKNAQLKDFQHGWKVYAADFVTAADGTGIAHEAPAFGADDWELLKKEQLPLVQHVNMDGTFKPEVKDFAGMEVKPRSEDDGVRLAADIAVLKYLQGKGLLYGKENITHAYPHCWRCDSPLLNYATSSWFVNVTKLKPGLLENAGAINWSPAHIKDGRWGKWLDGARDWSVSRQRFWASVIPIWTCEHCKAKRVFGSVAELEAASGKQVDDLHKHVVDEITFPCPECASSANDAKTALMRRVPDVLDTWFDSGSMPYGQVHYPFENRVRFEKTFPAQFIAEGQDQTRAWFYYLHVLAGALFKKNAFQNVVVNGIVLAEDGKKMSKKLQNYPDPTAIVDRYGADALRFYLLSSPVMQAENLGFSEKGVDEVAKKNLGRLQNVLAFWMLHDDGTVRDWKSGNVLDKWIIARLDQLIAEATQGYDTYRLDAGTRPISGFIDDLSVWYVRRSRERFKEAGKDRTHALATLRFVLHRLSLVMAPSMPFMAEHLFQAVREGEDEESVHLATWPEISHQPSFWTRLFGGGDESLVVLGSMEAAREIVSQALEAREKAGIKVRQPLNALTADSERLTGRFNVQLLAVIAEEVNVKTIIAGDKLSLDTTVTPELKEEGFVRDTIRAIQAFRKESGLKPGEPARYVANVAPEQKAVIEKHRGAIEKATGTTIEFPAT